MTSFAKALPFFFLLVLFSSLQVEARQRLFFSKITRSNGNEPDFPVTAAPTPSYSPLYEPSYAPAPELTEADAPTTSSYSPLYGPTYAPAPELTAADAPTYSPSYTPAPESTASDAPAYSPLSDVPTYAPESTAADAPTYSPLYGPRYTPVPESPSEDAPVYSPLYAPAADAPEEGALLVPVPAPLDSEPELGYGLFGPADQETPTSMDHENEGPYENTLYDDNRKYTTNYDTDRYTTNYINSREGFTNSYDGSGARNGNNVDGFEQQGMSDTRSLENGSLYQDDEVQNENNDEFNNGYQSGRGSTTNEAYFGNSEEPNEFNTMEEYEKYQENLGYVH